MTMNTEAQQWINDMKQSEQDHPEERVEEIDKRHQRQDDYWHQLDEQIEEKRRLVALTKTKEKYGDGYNADGEFQTDYRQQEYDRQGRRLEDQNDENRKLVSERKLKNDQGDAYEALVHKMTLKAKQGADDKLERKQRQMDDPTDEGAAQVLEDETEVISERDKRHQRQDDYSHQLDEQIEEKRRLVALKKTKETYGDWYKTEGDFETDFQKQVNGPKGPSLQEQLYDNQKLVPENTTQNDQGDEHETQAYKMTMKTQQGVDDKIEREWRQQDHLIEERAAEIDKRHQRQDDYWHQLDEQIEEKRRLVALTKTKEKYGDGYNADGKLQTDYRQQEYDRQGRRLEDQNDENRKLVSERKLKNDQGDAYEALVHKIALKAKQGADDKLERKQRQLDDPTDDGAARVLEDETEVLSQKDKRHQRQDDYSHQLDEQIVEKHRLVALTKTREKYGGGYNADGEFQTDYLQQRQQEYDRQGRLLEDQNDENRKVVSARKLKNDQGEAYEALVHKMALKAKQGADDKLERKQRQLDDPTDDGAAQVLEDETEVLSEKDKRHQRQYEYSHQLDDQIEEKRRLVSVKKTREDKEDALNGIRF